MFVLLGFTQNREVSHFNKTPQENPLGGIRVVPCGTRNCIANALKIAIMRKHSFSPPSPKREFDTVLVLEFI
jgi:hypothetical protein